MLVSLRLYQPGDWETGGGEQGGAPNGVFRDIGTRTRGLRVGLPITDV